MKGDVKHMIEGFTTTERHACGRRRINARMAT
jgi:hypothetical protein